MSESLAKYLARWFGRQVGHVKGAVKGETEEKKLYEKKVVEEARHPDDPKVVLRRTTIDEAIKKER